MDSIVDNYVAIDAELPGRPRGDRGRRLLRLGSRQLGDDLPAQARGARVPPGGDTARRAAAAAARTGHGPTSPTRRCRLLFRDVADHLLRVIDHVESYDRLLTDILSAHLTQVSVQQNDDMRKISAWVAIAAVPTMIAGIYGMNFENMPELHWQYGYFVALGADGGALRRAVPRVPPLRLAL